MTDFQQIVEECLTRLANGTSTVEECLARYPEHAKQLRPLLRTVYFLNVGPNSKAFPAFQSPQHTDITEYLRKRPQQPRRLPVFGRLAFTVAMLIMALLVTTTAQAQTAVPGDNLYDWKRTSEKIWRSVSVDVVATDIAIANRRMDELRAVAYDPQLSASAMNGYLEVLTRLEAVNDTASLALIVPAIQSHQQTLTDVHVVASNSSMSNYLIEEIETFSTQASAIVASASVVEVLPAPTRVPPTATDVPPPTATDVPPEPTNVPPEPTDVPPTATEVPPTATEVPPPTATEVPPPTATEVPPTEVPPTEVPPTEIPPTDGPPAPTADPFLSDQG